MSHCGETERKEFWFWTPEANSSSDRETFFAALVIIPNVLNMLSFCKPPFQLKIMHFEARRIGQTRLASYETSRSPWPSASTKPTFVSDLQAVPPCNSLNWVTVIHLLLISIPCVQLSFSLEILKIWSSPARQFIKKLLPSRAFPNMEIRLHGEARRPANAWSTLCATRTLSPDFVSVVIHFWLEISPAFISICCLTHFNSL